MKYFYDDKAQVVIAVDESGARVLPAIGEVAAGGGSEPKKKKPDGNKKWKELDHPDGGIEEKPAKKGKLSEIQKSQLEAEVIADLPVAEIAGRFEVSSAYVYMVRMRLKKEGKI